MNDLTERKIAVIGFGVTGRSCAAWYARHGYAVRVFDTRSTVQGVDEFKKNFPGVDVQLGELDVNTLCNFERVLVSPGIPINGAVFQTLINDGVDVLGDVQVFAEENTKPVVAITGSNGKSTVTMLVGDMLKAAGKNIAIAGNIGTPVLDVLDEATYDAYVLELSSFQMETTTSLASNVAVVLNVSPDHMDRYHGIDDYAAAKAKIYCGAQVSVVNRDDPLVMEMQTSGRVIGFTLHEPDDDDYGLRSRNDEMFLCKGHTEIIAASELPVAGLHNCANVLAALAICDGLDLDPIQTLDAIRSFRGLDHRTQLVAQHAGVNWFDDSKGTNVGATIAAVDGMQGPVVLIAGGQSKGQDFRPLRAALKRKAKAVVLFGEDADVIESEISDAAPIYRVRDMNEAVQQSRALAQSGDNVLLSPACASFDMFENYMARGKAFVSAVETMYSDEC